MTSLTSRRTLIILAAIACTLGALTFTSAAALAATEYGAVGTFGSAGAGAGQFNEPSGVAVNGASEPALQPAMGDVYVIDAGNQRVEQFSATGTYISQWDGSATPAHSFAFTAVSDSQGVAVDSSNNPLDPTAGDVYVMDTGHKVIDRFSASGKYEGQLQGTCAAPGTCAGKEVPFPGELRGVAVDPDGNLWVYEGGEIPFVDEFSDTGAFLASFNTPFNASTGLAVDAKDNVYAVPGYGNAVKYDESGNFITSFGSTGVRELAVNQVTSEVLLDDGSFIERFAPVTTVEPASEEVFARESLAESHGIAVNGLSAEKTVYASQSGADDVVMFEILELPGVGSTRYFNVNETGMSLEAVVRPEGHAITSCSFEYGSTNAYGQSVPCEQSLEAINKTGEPVAVTAKVAGLAPANQRYVRLAAGNANGTKRGQFAVIARPTIEQESASRVGSIEATLAAVIDSNDSSGAGTVSYRVEYGTANVAELSTPLEDVGAGQQPFNVQVSLSDLQAGSVYHARFVATGPLGTTFGPEIAFTTLKATVGAALGSTCPNATYTGFEVALPDCRAYELVSLAADDTYVPDYGLAGGFSEATGEITGIGGDVRSAESGDAITYIGGPTASGVGGNGYTGNGSGNDYLAARGAKGWEASDISLAVTTEAKTEYTNFSSDLAVQTLYSPRFPEMHADPEPAPECATGIQFSHTASGLHALTPENFGESNCTAETTGISANDRHILLSSSSALLPSANVGIRGKNLFDSVDGVLHQVNILPGGEPEAHPNSALGWAENFEPGSQRASDGAVSTDGSHVFWSSLEGGEAGDVNALYVRENDTEPQSPVVDGRCTTPADACTVQVDAAEAGALGPSGRGHFAGASGDGSKVFFIDGRRLTRNATAAAEEPDLYEYEVNAEAGAPGRLTDLTADPHERANVQGVVGISEDGSYVYFVAGGALAGTNSEGRSPAAEQPNLYMYHDGHTTFVATLTASDDDFQHGEEEFYVPQRGDWHADPGYRTAEVTPGGRAVGFMSKLSLTGYENKGVPEVFVYEAGTDRITCASCSPTGAPPSSFVRGAAFEGSYVGMSGTGSFVLRWINEREGVQVYFMTNQSLASDDTNAHQDVYEWESDGSGNCRETAGCIGLLSNAGAAGNAYFMDASAAGRDVFISSRSSLTPIAFDETVKVYDVRVDGGIAENRLSCTGTGCQGLPPGLPIFATPASVTFNGVGNFEPAPPSAQTKSKSKKLAKCRKGDVRKRGKCVKSRPEKKAKKVKRSARKSSTARKGR